MSSNELYNQQEVLQRVAEGDERAFMILYKHYYPALKPIVIKYLNSGIEAEEILQLAFVKVWLNRDKLPEIENLRAWIYKITYREYLMAIRKRLRDEEGMNRYSSSMKEEITEVQPHDIANLKEIKDSIQEVVNNLAPQRKAIYEMSRNEGLKIAEIAERLSISTQTVKNVLFIVIKMIREHLIAKGFGPLSFIFFLNYFIH